MSLKFISLQQKKKKKKKFRTKDFISTIVTIVVDV